jgi:hypothetical protein
MAEQEPGWNIDPMFFARDHELTIKRGAMSTNSQCVLQLPLGHLRAALDVAPFRLLIKLLTRMSIGLAGSRNRGAMAARGLLAGIAPSHRLGAFPLPVGTDMRSAFTLLLRRPSLCFLLFGTAKVAAIAFGAVEFRGAGFLQGNRDRLTTVLDLACLAASSIRRA